jgi:branched-chain amino acid transport system permease protein
VLELRGVSASYGALRVLTDLDLAVHAGEVHALVGPNGSGKSTALRVAAGVLRPTTGDVLVHGQLADPGEGGAARVRRGIARTLQRTTMLGTLDAATQVAVGARATDTVAHTGMRELLRTPRGRTSTSMRAATTRAALTAVGLDQRARLPAARLDSAEQRLLQVARVLATDADVVMLDEPAAGMSADQRRRLVEVIRGIARTGRGVLLVEHDMALVGRAADRVTVLDHGQVIASGTPAQVRADPAVRRAYLGPDTAEETTP